MTEGYIKLYRQICENEFWNEKPFSRGQAWVDLLLKANFKDCKKLIKGQLVELKRGQFIRGIDVLADDWGWSRMKVRRFLDMLEQEGMIAKNGTPNGTLVTVENYAFFQDGRPPDDTPSDTPGDTPDDTPDETRYKKVKKDKKGKNIYTPPAGSVYGEFENVYLTDEEYEKLVDRFPMDYQTRIESLSRYLKNSGKKYGSHYATILSWAERSSKEKAVPSKLSRWDEA